MRCAATPMARSAASPASYARRSARRRPSPSRPGRAATTGRAAPRAMTSTWSNVSTAGFARRPARSMPSSKGPTSSSRPRPGRSLISTRSACLPTAIAGSARSPRTSRATRRICEAMKGHARALAGSARSPRTARSTRRIGEATNGLPRDLLLPLLRRVPGRGRDGRCIEESGAFGVVPHSGFRQRRGAVHPDGRGVSRADPDHRLCRRGPRAVPVRGDDARRRFRPTASGLPAISADRRLSRHGSAHRVGAGRGHLGDRARRATGDRHADSGHCQDVQRRGARARALHALRLLLPGRRRRAAGCHGRRDRVDAAAQAERQAAEHRRPDRAHQGDRDRGRQGAAGPRALGGAKRNDMTIGLGHYLTVAAILFTIGIFGIFLNRKNVIVILMSIELILLAVNINLVAFSSFLGDLVGQVFALLVLTVAAAEAAIGLAILVAYYRNRGSIAVEDINLMKG